MGAGRGKGATSGGPGATGAGGPVSGRTRHRVDNGARVGARAAGMGAPRQHQQDYWWLFQIITPITRLPPELLQQILLIIIDNANDSPLVLMRVCKYWYNIVTGIWASFKLGTTTPRNAITRELERNQWLLDVLVDTEIDCVHFTPSKRAYRAIFAAISATSRWRTFVIETFPAHAQLPEHLVNRGLRQCSDPVMSRLLRDVAPP